MQRKSAYALASLCVSIKASYSLIQDTKRGFYFTLDSCLIVERTLNKGKPDSWDVNTTRAMEKIIMEIKCTSCGFTSNGPDTFSGKKLKCPKCAAEFVVGIQCEFTEVEDTPIAVQNKKETIIEKSIGKIGALEVTNKRIRGSINKKTITANGMPIYERVSIDILHNLITGITVQVVKNKGRLFCFICGPILILAPLLLVAIAAPLLSLLPLGIIVLVIGTLCEDKVHLILSVAGVDYFIPYETSQTKEAEEKCKLLKDAKSEYEHIVGI